MATLDRKPGGYVGVSCCGCGRDDLFLEILRVGLDGYLVCDGPAEILAIDLARGLHGTPVWPSERMERLVRRLSDSATAISEIDLKLIRLRAQGHGYEEMGTEVGLSAPTIRRHLAALCARLDLPSVTALIAWAGERGLLADAKPRPMTIRA